MGIIVVVGGLFGLASGVLVQYFRVQPFIATLAMMFLARGLASILSTTPIRLDDASGFRTLATQWKVIDGPKVNDLVNHAQCADRRGGGRGRLLHPATAPAPGARSMAAEASAPTSSWRPTRRAIRITTRG